MIRKVLVIGVLALLQGCATPFAQFYYDRTGGADLSKLPSVVLPTGELQVYRGNDQEQDALKMFAKLSPGRYPRKRARSAA